MTWNWSWNKKKQNCNNFTAELINLHFVFWLKIKHCTFRLLSWDYTLFMLQPHGCDSFKVLATRRYFPVLKSLRYIEYFKGIWCMTLAALLQNIQRFHFVEFNPKKWSGFNNVPAKLWNLHMWYEAALSEAFYGMEADITAGCSVS